MVSEMKWDSFLRFVDEVKCDWVGSLCGIDLCCEFADAPGALCKPERRSFSRPMLRPIDLVGGWRGKRWSSSHSSASISSDCPSSIVFEKTVRVDGEFDGCEVRTRRLTKAGRDDDGGGGAVGIDDLAEGGANFLDAGVSWMMLVSNQIVIVFGRKICLPELAWSPPSTALVVHWFFVFWVA